MIRQELDLNLGDGEVKCDVLGEVLDLTARRSLQFFVLFGKILWKTCVIDGDTIVGTATGFGGDTLGILK